jgi:hypothetical protein
MHDEEFIACLTFLDKLERGVIMPEYVIFNEFIKDVNMYSYELCMEKFEKLKLYELEKTFTT